MKPGARLKSAVCTTEVMVIKCGDGKIECGGALMVEEQSTEPSTLNENFANGSFIGKRYQDTDGNFELLCVKPGKGSLSVNGTALIVKDAKPLPASD